MARLVSEYVAWKSMKARCSQQKRAGFANYGGRGIKVCERWLNSYAAFLEDMGSKPSPMHSLDRINNDGNYEPGNCRWATRLEQNQNRRTGGALFNTTDTDGQPISVWSYCSKYGVPYRQIMRRIRDRNWPIDRALSVPLGFRRHP